MSTTASLGTSLLDMGSRKATLATVRGSCLSAHSERADECIQTCDGSSARDGERSSHFQDIRKFILALTGIRDARGISVQGLESRAGHRAAAANGQVQRGGKREKKVATEDPWFNSDVAET